MSIPSPASTRPEIALPVFSVTVSSNALSCAATPLPPVIVPLLTRSSWPSEARATPVSLTIEPLFVASALSTSIWTPPLIVPLLTSTPSLPALFWRPMMTPAMPPEMVPALSTDAPLTASTP